MREAFRRALIGAALAIGLAAPAAAAGLPADEADVVARLLPEVVNITVVQLVPPPNAPKNANLAAYTRKVLSGSGFIVDPSGIIVTNRHVVENAYQITAVFSDRTRRLAKLVYTAPIDMALLKVESPGGLPAVTFGDSALMRPGDPVIAIGNPLGIGTTVTSGIVSALDRDIQETPFDAFIQTDAAINHGNSGGPLFNLKGEVIGINTALFSPGAGSVGLGFAIPGNDAQFVLDQVHKYGRVRSGFLGVSTQVVTSAIAEAVGLDRPQGVMVDTVLPHTAAADALRSGDVILKVGDAVVNEPRDFNRAVGRTPFDTMQTVTYWRGGSSQTVSLKFGESPNSQPPTMDMLHVEPMMMELTPEDIGFSLSQITPDLRKQFKLPPATTGVVITSVTRNSIADEDGVVAGDVVMQVGDTPVQSTADLAAPLHAARTAGRSHILVKLWRAPDIHWVAMPLEREMMQPTEASTQ